MHVLPGCGILRRIGNNSYNNDSAHPRKPAQPKVSFGKLFLYNFKGLMSAYLVQFTDCTLLVIYYKIPLLRFSR